MLSADFADLERDIRMVNQSEATLFHLDVMDGVFVPNISFGFPVIKAISRHAEKPLDVHMMVTDPGRFVKEVRDAGGAIMNVHQEACIHLDRVVNAIKDAGMKAAVTLNPATPIWTLEDIITEVDMVLLMSVNPGYGGQKFIPYILDKCRRLKKLIADRGSKAVVQIDGGVNLETGRQLAQAGADILVAGSYVFKAKDPTQAIKALSEVDK